MRGAEVGGGRDVQCKRLPTKPSINDSCDSCPVNPWLKGPAGLVNKLSHRELLWPSAEALGW